MNCKWCNRAAKSANSAIQHEIRCKLNPNKIPPSPRTDKWRESMKNKVPSNQFIAARETGIPVVVTEQTRKKISDSLKKQASTYWTPERRLQLSNSMKQAVLNNPDSYSAGNVCGRVKVQDYKGEKFHGKWEVLVAEWLDANNIEWIRKVEPFNYFWNNGWHLYFPDFYLPSLDVYLEVKGYETDRDRCKWAAVKNLIVIKQKEIEAIKNNTYSLEQP